MEQGRISTEWEEEEELKVHKFARLDDDVDDNDTEIVNDYHYVLIFSSSSSFRRSSAVMIIVMYLSIKMGGKVDSHFAFCICLPRERGLVRALPLCTSNSPSPPLICTVATKGNLKLKLRFREELIDGLFAT